MFVPIERLPSGIDEIRDSLSIVFSELHQPVPTIRQDVEASSTENLDSGFLIIEGLGEGHHCWASISRCGSELTGLPNCELMVDIKTRGSCFFAGIVAYAFCRLAGTVIFNDACELDGQETYTADTIKKVLLEWIDGNCHHL